MDIEEALRKLREAVMWELNRTGDESNLDVAENAQVMAEVADAIDGLLSKRGALPGAWAR